MMITTLALCVSMLAPGQASQTPTPKSPATSPGSAPQGAPAPKEAAPTPESPAQETTRDIDQPTEQKPAQPKAINETPTTPENEPGTNEAGQEGIGDHETAEPDANADISTPTIEAAAELPPIAAGLPHKFLVMIAGGNVNASQGPLLEAWLIAELQKYEGVEPISVKERKLSKPRVCKNRMACVEQVAREEQSSQLVTAEVYLNADVEALILSLTDLTDRRVVRRAKVTVHRREGALAALGDAVKQLFPKHNRKPNANVGLPIHVAQQWRPPPVDAWVFYTAAGTTAALLTGAAVTTYFAHRQDDVDQQRRLGKARNAMWAATGASALTTLMLAYFTDFAGVEASMAVVPAEGGASAWLEYKF